jgi:hypothetical protein
MCLCYDVVSHAVYQTLSSTTTLYAKGILVYFSYCLFSFLCIIFFARRLKPRRYYYYYYYYYYYIIFLSFLNCLFISVNC